MRKSCNLDPNTFFLYATATTTMTQAGFGIKDSDGRFQGYIEYSSFKAYAVLEMENGRYYCRSRQLGREYSLEDEQGNTLYRASSISLLPMHRVLYEVVGEEQKKRYIRKRPSFFREYYAIAEEASDKQPIVKRYPLPGGTQQWSRVLEVSDTSLPLPLLYFMLVT